MNINSPFSYSQPTTHQASSSNESSLRVNNADAGNVQGQTLRHRITPRTQDYLLRFSLHGTPQEKKMANKAYNALLNDAFVESAEQKKPALQYGINATIDGQEGILLANLMPHDNQLDLVALGFCEERHFESEAGKIPVIVLEHAEQKPEIKIAQHLKEISSEKELQESRSLLVDEGSNPQSHKGSNAAASSSAGPSEAEIDKARKDLQKDINDFNKHSMRHHMHQRRMQDRLEQGLSKNPLAANISAHVDLSAALFQKNIFHPLKNRLTRHNVSNHSISPYPSIHQSINPSMDSSPLTTPPGDQYRFKKEELVNFSDHCGAIFSEDITTEAAEHEGSTSKNRQNSLNSTLASLADPTRRHARLLGSSDIGILSKGLSGSPISDNGQIIKDDASDTPQGSSKNKRHAKILNDDERHELQDWLGQPSGKAKQDG